MYAVKTYKSWRCVEEGSDLQEGETLMTFIPPPTQEEAFADYCKMVSDGVLSWLNSYVDDSYDYAGIGSAVTYNHDKNPVFNEQGSSAKNWRSDCFTALYAAMPQYAALPPDQWPTIEYITANLPQPSAYQWEPS